MSEVFQQPNQDSDYNITLTLIHCNGLHNMLI